MKIDIKNIKEAAIISEKIETLCKCYADGLTSIACSDGTFLSKDDDIFVEAQHKWRARISKHISDLEDRLYELG